MIDWFPIQLSLRVAALATLFALTLGLGAGWILARHNLLAESSWMPSSAFPWFFLRQSSDITCSFFLGKEALSASCSSGSPASGSFLRGRLQWSQPLFTPFPWLFARLAQLLKAWP